MRILVTGGSGFAGSFLVDDLVAAGHEVAVLARAGSASRVRDGVEVVVGDLLEREGLIAAVAAFEPALIYHLAGWASVGGSWREPALPLAVNAGGTANLLDAAVAGGKPRVVVVTSAEIYGVLGYEDLPITEERTPAPNHPYGISKWAAAQLVPLYAQRDNLPVIEARPFNHIGPRQSLGFVVADFASQLAAIKLGQKEPQMLVGNLDAQRDFTDVRDMVRAYQLLGEKGEIGERYLICSGAPVAISNILNTLIDLSGINVEVAYDPQRMRPSDTPCVYGSYAKLRRATGWEPEIHLRQSLSDALDYWVERLGDGGGEG
ncbi:MAG TPA: GDP-mannose 4,6-dehydratase [Anaerolineae bacterium]|nr:GDP-mannose 4,6-dehydratase [Anaerolineae bacterium]